MSEYIYCHNEKKTTEAIAGKCSSCQKTLEELLLMAEPEKQSKAKAWKESYDQRIAEAKSKPKKSNVVKTPLQKAMDKQREDFSKREPK